MPRYLRRRATANVRNPTYYSKNNVIIEIIYYSKPSLNHKRDPSLRYLELHNWNAKRMRMQPLWGWMLPYSHLQRDVGYFLKVLYIDFALCIIERSKTTSRSRLVLHRNVLSPRRFLLSAFSSFLSAFSSFLSGFFKLISPLLTHRATHRCASSPTKHSRSFLRSTKLPSTWVRSKF